MDKSKEDLTAVKQTLSPQRFESYRKTSYDSDEKIIERYKWSMEVSRGFYHPLHVLEVTFRNSYDSAWRVNPTQKDWLMAVPAWLDEYGQESVVEAHEALAARGQVRTNDRVVQELNFGFWTSLLNRRYESNFHRLGHVVFPGLPTSSRVRSNVAARLDSIRTLRNRIFHHRRIWNRPNLRRDFDELIETIEWVRPGTTKLLLGVDVKVHFDALFTREPS